MDFCSWIASSLPLRALVLRVASFFALIVTREGDLPSPLTGPLFGKAHLLRSNPVNSGVKFRANRLIGCSPSCNVPRNPSLREPPASCQGLRALLLPLGSATGNQLPI